MEADGGDITQHGLKLFNFLFRICHSRVIKTFGKVSPCTLLLKRGAKLQLSSILSGKCEHLCDAILVGLLAINATMCAAFAKEFCELLVVGLASVFHVALLCHCQGMSIDFLCLLQQM